MERTWQVTFSNFAGSDLNGDNQVLVMIEKEQDKLVSLSDVEAGRTVRFAAVDAGHRLRSHLAALGLIANVPIHIIRNSRSGQIILSVRNSKIVLGRGISHKILVREM